jgi:hypothetical protein
MFLGAKSKRVYVNTLIRIAGVGLVRLDPAEVRSFTLREAVLSVKLELSSYNGVLSPAVHVKRGFGKNEGTGIRYTRVVEVTSSTEVGLGVGVSRTVPVSGETITWDIIKSTRILEKTTSIDEGAAISSNSCGATESMDGVGESVNSIGVVEGLSTKNLEEKSIAGQR